MRPEDLPAGPVIVDTMIVSWLFVRSGKHAAFKPFVDHTLAAGHRILISFATLGEIRAWAHKLEWNSSRVAQLDLALKSYVVLPYDEVVTQHYGVLQAKLGDQLKKYGRNDMWTAACALSHAELPSILTDDLADFQRIQAEAPQLRLAHPDL